MKNPDPEQTIIWFLIWLVLMVIVFIGQAEAMRQRAEESRHQAVMQSMIPPSTANVSTR